MILFKYIIKYIKMYYYNLQIVYQQTIKIHHKQRKLLYLDFNKIYI